MLLNSNLIKEIVGKRVQSLIEYQMQNFNRTSFKELNNSEFSKMVYLNSLNHSIYFSFIDIDELLSDIKPFFSQDFFHQKKMPDLVIRSCSGYWVFVELKKKESDNYSTTKFIPLLNKASKQLANQGTLISFLEEILVTANPVLHPRSEEIYKNVLKLDGSKNEHLRLFQENAMLDMPMNDIYLRPNFEPTNFKYSIVIMLENYGKEVQEEFNKTSLSLQKTILSLVNDIEKNQEYPIEHLKEMLNEIKSCFNYTDIDVNPKLSPMYLTNVEIFIEFCSEHQIILNPKILNYLKKLSDAFKKSSLTTSDETLSSFFESKGNEHLDNVSIFLFNKDQSSIHTISYDRYLFSNTKERNVIAYNQRRQISPSILRIK